MTARPPFHDALCEFLRQERNLAALNRWSLSQGLTEPAARKHAFALAEEGLVRVVGSKAGRRWVLKGYETSPAGKAAAAKERAK